MSTLHHEEILEDCLIEAEENFRVQRRYQLQWRKRGGCSRAVYFWVLDLKFLKSSQGVHPKMIYLNLCEFLWEKLIGVFICL